MNLLVRLIWWDVRERIVEDEIVVEEMIEGKLGLCIMMDGGVEEESEEGLCWVRWGRWREVGEE